MGETAVYFVLLSLARNIHRTLAGEGSRSILKAAAAKDLACRHILRLAQQGISVSLDADMKPDSTSGTPDGHHLHNCWIGHRHKQLCSLESIDGRTSRSCSGTHHADRDYIFPRVAYATSEARLCTIPPVVINTLIAIILPIVYGDNDDIKQRA